MRNDGQNVFGGFGDIALFDVVIVDNISTLTDALFTPGNLRAITASQFPLLFGSQNDRVVLDPPDPCSGSGPLHTLCGLP